MKLVLVLKLLLMSQSVLLLSHLVYCCRLKDAPPWDVPPPLFPRGSDGGTVVLVMPCVGGGRGAHEEEGVISRCAGTRSSRREVGKGRAERGGNSQLYCKEKGCGVLSGRG